MNIQRILKYFIYACAFVPLIIFSQYISPFHFGKVVIFRSLIEIMLALYVVLAWRDRSYLPRRDGFFWAFLGFTLAFTLATFTSINIYQSFWGTLERMGGLYSFWHYFAFYVILASVLRTKEDWLTFLKLTVGVGVLSALYGFGQKTDITFFIGGPNLTRIFGTIGNAALFAGYQIINVFLALTLGFTAQKKNERNLYLIGAAIMTLAVLMTAVRGSLVGIAVGFLVFALLYFMQTHAKRAKQVFLGLVVLAVLFVGFAFTFKNSTLVQNSSYLKRVTDFSLTNYTVETRIWAWQAGLKGWSEGPKTVLVGWGPENFNIPFSKYFNPQFFRGPGSETLFDRAHNMFVEVLVTMGLIGLLAYLWLFVTIFRTMWKVKEKPELRVYAIGMIAMIVAYVIHNSFIFDTSANFIVFFSALGFMSFLAHSAMPAGHQPASQPRKVPGFVPVLLLIVALFIVYKTNIVAAEANYATTRGIIAGAGGDFAGAVAKYEESIAYNVAGKYDYRNRFSQFLLDYSISTQTLDPGFADAVKTAITEEEKNAAENPHDYLPELYLSRLNITLGKNDPKSPYNDEALKHSLIALSYSETFVRTYYEVGQAYLNKNDFVNAAKMFQKAVDLNPDVSTSYWYLGITEVEGGQVDAGLKIIDTAIQKGYGPSENDYLGLASIYIKRNDYARLAVIYKALTSINPNSGQYHASLAVVYAKLGRIDDAVAEARLAAAADPNFAPQAKLFVQSLGRTW